jgi:hypothetical protein
MRGFANMLKSGFAKKLLFVLGIPALVGAQTYPNFVYWNVRDTSKVPKLLSASGMYPSKAAIEAKVKTVRPNAHHFEVNSALWSDDSKKKRWVMTKAGTSIKYAEKSDYYGYPDSAVFMKQFAIDTIIGDSSSRVLWETRFLVNRKDTVAYDTVSQPGIKIPILMDHWYGYSYKWNPDQKDAKLIPATGQDDSIRVWPKNKVGASMIKKWRFPSRSQCDQCHRVDYADTLHGRSVLGFFTAQLNRPHPDTANINQLEYFFNKGVLTGTKSVWDATTTPRWYAVDDSTNPKATLDIRARAYIAANCSGCHGTRGMATNATFGVDFNYDFHTMEAKMDFRHRTTSWPFTLDEDSIQPKYYPKTDLGNNPNAYDSLLIDPALVVPGYPQKSVILFRQTQRNYEPGIYEADPKQMPLLATYEVNYTAVNVIRKWIAEMPKTPAPRWNGIRLYSARTNLKGPAIQGRHLVLPSELAGPGNVKVTLTGITGRTLELTRLSRTAYALPNGLTPGVYVIKVGKQNFTRYLF